MVVVDIPPFADNNPPIVPASLIVGVRPIKPREELILPDAVMFVVVIEPLTAKLFLTVVVPVPDVWPIFTVDAAPPKLIVVAVEFNNGNVVWSVTIPLTVLTFNLFDKVVSPVTPNVPPTVVAPVKVEVPVILKLPEELMLPLAVMWFPKVEVPMVNTLDVLLNVNSASSLILLDVFHKTTLSEVPVPDMLPIEDVER